MTTAGLAAVAAAMAIVAALAIIGAQRARRSERRVVRHSEARDVALAEAKARKSVAEQQVNLLVQLANRAQVLLDRQIDRLVEFEREETDTAALDNLITLEQLALQARRSTEAALVAGGQANPRRWDHVVLLTDVVRAAVAEVDGYKRVHVRAADDGMELDGAVVADIAHLLAELIDSALMAAAPAGPVDVERHAATVTISHNAPASWANERAAVDGVVELLAQRHGIAVSRSDATVVVTIPDRLLSVALGDETAEPEIDADTTDAADREEVDVTEAVETIELEAAAPLRALSAEMIGLPSFESPAT